MARRNLLWRTRAPTFDRTKKRAVGRKLSRGRPARPESPRIRFRSSSFHNPVPKCHHAPGTRPMGAERKGYLPKSARARRRRRAHRRKRQPDGHGAEGRRPLTQEFCRRRNRRLLWRKNPVPAPGRSLGAHTGNPDPGNKSAAVERGLRKDRGIRQSFRTSSLIGKTNCRKAAISSESWG